MLIATEPKAKPVGVVKKARLVGVEKVQPQTLTPSLTLCGKVESQWSSPPTAGVVADVIEGDLLLRLDERDRWSSSMP